MSSPPKRLTRQSSIESESSKRARSSNVCNGAADGLGETNNGRGASGKRRGGGDSGGGEPLASKYRVVETSQMPDYFVVIDLEATCEKDVNSYINEIIEFPALLVCTRKNQIVCDFREFVKPRINPELSNFCMSLTDIEQSVVDEAADFPNVFNRFQKWMEKHKLGTEKTFTIVTDHPKDISRFLYLQCIHSKVRFPAWAGQWINIRKPASVVCNEDCTKLTLTAMLEKIGMKFEGRQHRGIDDARNIAQIVMKIIGDGRSAILSANEKIEIERNGDIRVNVKVCTEHDLEGGNEKEVYVPHKSVDRIKCLKRHGTYVVSLKDDSGTVS